MSRRERFAVTTPENLRSLCIKKGWFDNGSNEQYEKLFAANRGAFSVRDVAVMVWTCSDAGLEEIEKVLEKERESYLETLGLAQHAEGERAADEIYCSYFE